jgi:DUF1680 family protein
MGDLLAFQKLLEQRAALAADWLARSIAACGGNGSAAFYSRWVLPRRGWSWPYPETTGYIIPTLLDYGGVSGRSELTTLAVQQADWIVSLQYDDGALPGDLVVRGVKKGPSAFNTGQMILGLVACADHTGVPRYLDSAHRAALWLASEVDPNAGTWTRHAYVAGFSPAYYTRVAWPMLEVCERTQDERVKDAALRVLDTIAGWQRDNGAIRNWGFSPASPAFTHTIAYTIRGFLESARILRDEGARFQAVAVRCAEAIRNALESRGRLAGAYDLDLKGRYWYTCLTGNCQMAIVWMRLYDSLRDSRFLDAALTALQFVMDRQRVGARDSNLNGAIAGSSPLWGRYMAMRYPNWATKFYLDALMEARRQVGILIDEGESASPPPGLASMDGVQASPSALPGSLRT